jgi:hypothetical protein
MTLPGCMGRADSACGTGRASELVEAAKQSGVLRQVPAGWAPQPVYGECDRDDEFVVAGRVLATPQADLDRYLEQQGATRGEDGDGRPCRTVLVSGLAFYVKSGSAPGGLYLELTHYLASSNTCQSVPSGAGQPLAD